MINKDNLNFLKSKPEDKDFHSSRIMFCIKDGRVKVAPPNVTDSHIEWFKKEGWTTEKNTEDFLKQNVRGFYLPDQNKLYCYRVLVFILTIKYYQKR